MIKGKETKTNILEIGLKQARKFGFESLSIGELAKLVGMSKSGLFAHFKSKELMQVMILDYAAENFVLKVIKPALKQERGLPRLEAIIANWIKWSNKSKNGGCPLISASFEFDDIPGKIRQATQKHLAALVGTLEQSIEFAIAEGHLSAKTNKKVLGYEVFSKIMGLHLYHRLLQDENAQELFHQSIVDLFKANS
jgi:AcrR family transcriptional regulator